MDRAALQVAPALAQPPVKAVLLATAGPLVAAEAAATLREQVVLVAVERVVAAQRSISGLTTSRVKPSVAPATA